MTMQGLIDKHQVRMTAKPTDHNPHMNGDAWSQTATHWKIVLRVHGRRFTTYFSQGPAISREPTATDVLDCLASDAAGIENTQDFTEWCSEYGFSDDSRKAERTYRACERTARQLKQLFGVDAYEELLWKVERE